MSISNLGADRFYFAGRRELSKDGSIVGWHDFIGAWTSNSEVIDATEDVLEFQGLSRYEDGVRLALGSCGSRPLDLIW